MPWCGGARLPLRIFRRGQRVMLGRGAVQRAGGGADPLCRWRRAARAL